MRSKKSNPTKQNKKKPKVPNKNNYKDFSFLRANELLLDQIRDSVILVDRSGIIISVNSKAEALFGKKKSLLLIKDVNKFLCIDTETDTQGFVESLQKFLASRRKTIELKNCKLILSKNNFLPVNCSITRLMNENSKTEIAAIILSLSIENDKTAKISTSGNNNSDFVYELPGFLYRCVNDKNWTMKFISEGCKDITGYKPHEFIENKKIAFNDIIHPDYRKPIRKKWLNTLKEKKYFEFEYPIITRKKEVKWVWERGKGIYSDKGKLLHLEGFITDITERKNTEAMLLLKNTVFESSISGNSIADIKGRITNLNAAFLNLWGYQSKSEVIGKNISYFFKKKKEASLIIKALNENGRWEGEFTALKKDGSTFLAFALATSVHDSEGRKIGYQSSVLDISERKSIEQEVEKNRDRMQLLVEGTPHLFFYVQNLEGYVEYISPSIENITGYKVSQWLNQRHWFITDSAINQKARARTHQHLSGEIDPSPVYVEIKHANGGTVTLESYERPIIKNGKVIGLQGVAHDITERIKSEEKLRASELSYQKLFDSVSEAIYIQDENGVFLDVNEGAVTMYGYDKKTLIGKTPEFVSAPNRNDLPSVITAVQKAFEGEKQQFQFWGKRKSGEEFLKDVRLYPAAQGNKKIIIAVATDITERTKAETLLKESEERFKNLFLNSPDAIFLADPKTGIIVDVNESALNLMKMNREQIVGLHQSKLHPPRYHEYARKSFDEHKRVDNSKIAIESYILNSEGEEVPVEVMANQIIVQGQELLQGVFRDLRSRKKIEQSLYESEKKFRSLFEHSTDAMLLLNEKHFFDCNKAALDMLNCSSKEDIVSVHPSELSPIYQPDGKLSSEKADQMIKFAFKTGANRFEWIHKKISGEEFPVEVSLTPIQIEGEEVLFTIWRDISERKAAEIQLKVSEEKYRTIAENINDTLYSIDRTGRFTYVSSAVKNILGYEPQEVIGKNISDFVYPEDLKLFPRQLRKIISNTLEPSDYRLIEKSGAVHWVRSSGKAIYANGEIVGFQGVMIDINNEKMFEQKLKFSEERYRIISNLTTDYLFSTLVDESGNHKMEWVAGSFEKITGYNIDEYVKIGGWRATLSPDELAKDDLDLERLKQNLKVNREVKTYHKDGSVVWVRSYAHPLWDEKTNTLKGVYGAVQDITETKKYIEALKAERDLFSSGPVSTIIWSPAENWPIKYVSSNIAEILGYSNYYLTDPGFNYSSIIHPDDLPRIMNEVKHFADNSIDTFEQSYRLKHRNGNYLWIYDYTKFVRDANGNITEIKGYLFDQTNLKNAQQEIENQKQRLANIIEGTNVGTWEWNVQTGETIFNERWAEIIGYTLNELKPISINTWLKVVHPDDLLRSEELLMKHFKGETEFYECEARVRHKDGHWIWIADKGKVVSRSDDNKPLMMFGTHQDITERKRSEILQHIQYKVADAAVSSIRLTELFESIRSELSTIMNVNNFFIALYDEKTGMLNSDVDRDEMEIIPEWPAKGSMTGYVIEQKRSVLVTKNQINHMIADGIAGMVGIIPEIWLGVPFRIGGKVIGVIVVQSYDNPNAYDHNSVEILEIVAHELSIFIQHKRAEEESQKLSKAIIQSPVSIIITDPQGKIEYVNPKFTEVSGYTLEEIKGETPSVLRTDEHGVEFYSKMWETISSGKDWQGEIRNRKKNGEIYWEASLISPILNDEGRITNYLAINEDITEKKKMIEELIIAKEKAEEMNRVKSNFFANMSHELRTPMVGILGFSEMLMTEFKDKPDYFTMIKSINASGQRLLDTLNMILNISKLEAAKVEPVLTVTNIVPLIRESYQFFESAASRKKLLYELSVLDDRILCNIDSFLFLSIINNLINNAIKFTSAGVIKVVVQISDSNASIRVSDSGVGISQEKLNLIWEEFRQASEGYNRSFEGTGLGLTISKRYTELMNGKINVESVIEKGTTFILTFPVVADKTEKDLHYVTADNSSESIKIIDNAPKVLYVEDDDVSIKLVRTITRGLYDFDSAKDSDEALELIKINKYGLILMDINLHKGMDGIELTQLIRKQKDYKDIPIVALTAFAMGHEKEEFLAKGMTHYLSKPFTRNQLLEILNDAFKPKEN